MEFTAIDVETANPDMASICQIGIASFAGEVLQEEWKTYVDPEDYFHPRNTSIHCIDESTIAGAPILPDIAEKICELLENRLCVCHTHFDRVAMQQAFHKHDLRYPGCEWLDSARVVRRTWKQFAQRGYGLENVCEFLGYEFTPHDALEDAKAAAYIINAAVAETGIADLSEWRSRVRRPIVSRQADGYTIEREGNPEGFLHGEVVVFTGTLEIRRREAADLAADVGCKVARDVTKNTTILVVGDQDVQKLAGHAKSAKHRKAEALISQGHSIRILRETDFKEIVKIQD